MVSARALGLATAALVSAVVAIALTWGPTGPLELSEIRIGYLPIYPDAQFLVAYGKGWFRELGVRDVKTIKFQQGVAMIQAFAAGELDVLYVGIDPVLVALEKGLPLRVVAANIINPLALVGTKELRDYYSRYGDEFLEAWARDKGRLVRIATLPRGTTPDILLRMFFHRIGENPASPRAEVLPMGIGAVRSALLTGEVDAAMIMEPIISLALERGYEVVVEGRLVLDNHPGAVLAVSLDLVRRRPDVVERLVEVHVKATKLLNEDKDEAARLLSEAIGESVLPLELARRALDSPFSNFVSNPGLIVKGTLEYHRFRATQLGGEARLSEEDIFDASFYEKVASRTG